MLSFADIIRGVLMVLILGAIFFFIFTLAFSLLPFILVGVVALWIFGAFSPSRRSFYVYSTRGKRPMGNQKEPVKPSSSKMIHVEAEVRDSP